MSLPPNAIAGHLAVLKNRLGDKGLPFCGALADNNWDVQKALDTIKPNVPEEDYNGIHFVYHVAVIFDDDERFFDILQTRKVFSIQQLALANLQELITAEFLPKNCVRDVFYEAVWGRLFELQPREVIITALKLSNLRPDFDHSPIVQALQSLKNWDILNAPVKQASEGVIKEALFTGKDSEMSFPKVIGWLERLQRTLALTRRHTVEAASAMIDLMNSEFESASSISAMPAKTFVSKFRDSKHPKSTWLAIHSRACSIQRCNMCVVDSLYNTARGSGMAVLDGPQTPADRLSIISKAGGDALKNVNLTELFHDLDSESCDDCNSVTSPAAYFVELLQFLRNNNVQTGHSDLSAQVTGTVLGRLFARRPDLGELELTCSNTTVVLPYLDLANEAMESYVVRQGIDVYDTRASSSEALAEPEHTNIEAYRILSTQVHPFTKLPYHQALDEVRIFLKHLKTSRYEVLDTMCPPATVEKPAITLERAMTSEYLNLMPEEYMGITAESGSGEEYKYWGYPSLISFQSLQWARLHGPQGVLARSGLNFSDLVELLQTAYINPDITDPDAIVIVHGDHTGGYFYLVNLALTKLTNDDWTNIRCFTQLWRKTGWRISEVDQAISGLGGAKGKLGIGADILSQIVAVMKLVELMGLEREMLLTFWTPITTRPDKDSLYTRLFLSHHIVSIDPIFAADRDGHFLLPTRNIKISDHETVVEATLGLTKEGLDAIKAKIEPTSDCDKLSIKNISMLYRHAMLAKFLCVTPAVLLQAIELFKIDPFSNATSCLEFVELWKGMEAVGFSFAQLRYALTGNDELLKPLGPSKVAIQRAIKKIQDSYTTLTNAAIIPKVVEGSVGSSVSKADFRKADSALETENVLAGHLMVDLIFSTLSEVSGLTVEILRVLLPDKDLQIPDDTVIVFLARAAIFINGFNLCAAEVQYLCEATTLFSKFHPPELSLSHWVDLLAYVKLRDSLPKVADSHYHPLLEMLGDLPTTTDKLAPWIAELLLVKPDAISELLSHFQLTKVVDGALVSFSGPNHAVSTLTKLKRAVDLADRLGTDVKRVIEWSKPTSDFMEIHVIAGDIRAMMRGRSNTEDWEKTIKPLRDQLRHNQREALVASLVVRPDLIDWGVVDEDSLFEYFLIDVKMGACLQTSRIKQAISTIQLFVQRCFYGLEERHGVNSTALDRERWEWMKHYRTWEANRMVFLYPENWVDPSLRDDKSPVFLEFESDLIQRDLNMQNIEETVESYVSRMDLVANLRDVITLDDERQGIKKIHFFARSQGSPFAYYYQLHDKMNQEWKPWEAMSVDVQTHQDQGMAECRYQTLIPLVVDGRLLVFTPLLVQTMVPAVVTPVVAPVPAEGAEVAALAAALTVTFGVPAAAALTALLAAQAAAPAGAAVATPKEPPPLLLDEKYEIRIGWTEYRKNKWTAKQLSSSSWLSQISKVSDLTLFAERKSGFVQISVGIRPPSSKQYTTYKAFRFANGAMELETAHVAGKLGDIPPEPTTTRIGDISTGTQSTDTSSPATATDPNTTTSQYNSLTSKLIGRTTTASTTTTASPTLRGLYKALTVHDPARPIGDHELRDRHGLYTWELGLHIPMLLMDRLASSHQYDKALEIAHLVFDPLCASGTDLTAVWKWPPFRKQGTIEDGIQHILGNLVGNTPAPTVEHWRDKPFQPHVVARDRPAAYMRWMVVRYIEILIASGDRLFRQNTMESVPLAIQYYTLASHLYGPPGSTIPGCHQKKNPKTFNSLLSGWDAFSNAIVELETAFPFHKVVNCFCPPSSQNPSHSWNRYFCVPRNKKLQDLRATIDDRLYKIRHCLDINGAKLTRALFEPPIDPGMLVRATAQGLSLANVLDHAGGPMPNYRFRYLLQKAFEMVQELKSLGSEFLAAKEKKDAHAYELIRNGHEHSINTLVLDMKKLNLVETNKTLEMLKKSRNGPFSRLNHYSQLIGEDIKQFATMQSFSNTMSAFKPIECGIEPPLSDDKLKLSVEEKSEIDYAGKATILRISSKSTDAAAAALLIIPQFETAVHPFGIGISTQVGTKMVSDGLRSVAYGMSAAADSLDSSSTHASRKAALIRQFQDRVQQANSAGYELEVLDTQIAAHLVRISVAEKDIQLQEKQIENALATENFLRTMYTSTELYSWQEKELRTLYYQAYTVAYDLAQKVERTFHYERGQTDTEVYIKDSWDANKDGLFSGEALGLGLRQLEAVYQQTRGHDFEITKHVSLRQLDPMAVLNLQETNRCEFKLPEVLFDMDFPGHYNRRLKSVSLSLPCVVGPYASTNCTLELTKHQYRVTSDTDPIAGATPPITSIAVSNGLHDAGVFELNFNAERYLPFEGAGAISEWTLSLPGFPGFDYRTISDAILHLKYTSMPGDPKRATKDVTAYLKGTQTALFDLPNELATAWYQRGNGQPMALRTLAARLPWRSQGKSITVTGIQLLTSGYAGIKPDVFQMTESEDKEVAFTHTTSVGRLEMFTGKAESGTSEGFGTIKGFENLKLSLKPGTSELKDLWMLVKYTCV